MWRIALGWLLILHALAHVSALVWTPLGDDASLRAVLSTLTFACYLAAGLGILRAPVARAHWKMLLLVATMSSMALIVWLRPAWGMVGVALDAFLLIAAEDVLEPRIEAAIVVRDQLGSDASAHPRWVRAGWIMGAVLLAYGSAVLLVMPTLLRWGTTPAERVAALPGDEVLPRNGRYRIDHAITIRAPAEAVWPWLVQLGQDRGGFYSYDWLERAFGDDIRNADRIHPEWQRRAVGDTIRATQPGYLGGRFGTLGWRVTALEPNRVIGLENWGNFVLQPLDSSTTRLIVRTRGDGTPSWLGLLLGPVDAFVFEPVHFIMERGMLRGIRDRAEGVSRT